MNEVGMTFPCWKQWEKDGLIVCFSSNTTGREFRDGILYEESDRWIPADNRRWNDIDRRSYLTFREVYGKDEFFGENVEPNSRGDGGSTSYYNLPEGATELSDLIYHKKMNHSIGESFCAIYRLNDNGEYARNIRKAIFYLQLELKHCEELK